MQPIHLFHHSNFCHCKNPDSHGKGAGMSPKGYLVQQTGGWFVLKLCYVFGADVLELESFCSLVQHQYL